MPTEETGPTDPAGSGGWGRPAGAPWVVGRDRAEPVSDLVGLQSPRNFPEDAPQPTLPSGFPSIPLDKKEALCGEGGR